MSKTSQDCGESLIIRISQVPSGASPEDVRAFLAGIEIEVRHLQTNF